MATSWFYLNLDMSHFGARIFLITNKVVKLLDSQSPFKL